MEEKTTYTLLRNILSHEKPSNKSLEDLFAALKRHFKPKRVVIAERFCFYRREQAAGETIAEYEAELRRLATHCQFEAHLSQALRDRLVCGLRNEATQKHLLSKSDLTLQQAVEIAQSMEAAERNTQQLKWDSTVHSVKPASAKEKECYHCGRKNHLPAKCRFKDAECHKCGLKGHIARVCRAKSSAGAQRKTAKTSYRGQNRTNCVQADQDSDSTDDAPDDSLVCQINGNSSRTMNVQLQINGIPLPMEIDTGAAVSIISEQTQRNLFPTATLQPTRIKLRTYTGEPMPMLGELTVDITYQQNHFTLPLMVVEGNGPSLFGRNWLQHICLDWKSLGVATVQEVPSPIEFLLRKYEDVFQEGLATMRPFKATLCLKSDAVSRFDKPRSVPFALKEAVGRELDEMEATGVLERVTHSR